MKEMDEDAVALNFLMLVMVYLRKKKRDMRTRRYAVRPLNRLRLEKGFYNNMMSFMIEKDHESFFKYSRMTPNLFNHLLSLIEPRLQRDPSRHPLPPAHRLIITLHFLAEGCSMREITWAHYIGHSTVCVIIHEVTRVLWEVLMPLLLKPPSKEDLQNTAEGFYKRWNLPNCIGAVDGKHVAMQAPPNAGSTFFNYKKHHSLVLMASCDAFYRFTMVDIGSAGSNHDSVVFSESSFGNAILKNKMDLPPPRNLPGTNTNIPHFLAADAAFPLNNNIMRPYPGQNLSIDKTIFNYRLSRARRVIENTFGILVQRWRVLRTTIIGKESTVEAIIMATLVLHNYLQQEEGDMPENERKYCPTGYVDSELADGSIRSGNWREDTQVLRGVNRLGSNNATFIAKDNRNILNKWLCSNVGMVPWQETYVLRGCEPT